jgi:hypothetical protein
MPMLSRRHFMASAGAALAVPHPAAAQRRPRRAEGRLRNMMWERYFA